MNKNANYIVYITDSNYAMPTCVSICSVVDSYLSENPVYIYLLCDNLSDKEIGYFKSIDTQKKNINIIVQDVSSEKYDELSHQMVEYSEQFHVSRAAILKFTIPSIFSDVSRILYIDSDTLVQSGFERVFLEDISDYYLAAVDDMGDIVDDEGHSYLSSRLNLCRPYFNSGIMFLNLEKMRQDDIEHKLFDYKEHGLNYFMDQDALNVVIGNKRKPLPYQYNFRSALLQVKTFDEINRDFYGHRYKTIKECISDQKILHLTDRLKPWKYYMSWFTDLFKKYYAISPYSDQNLPLISIELYYNRKIKEEEKTENDRRIQTSISFDALCDKYINARSWRIPTEFIPKGSKVVIYGAGKVGRSIKKQNDIFGYFDLVAWVDKNFESIKETVSSPSDLQSLNYEYVLVALADRKDALFAKEELSKSGIKCNKIVTLYDKEDEIEKAITNPQTLSLLQTMFGNQKQTWYEFTEKANDKKVILYGTGLGSQIYFSMQKNGVCPLFLIDDDAEKWEKEVTDYLPEAIPFVSCGKMKSKICATNKEFFSELDENTVVVISLLKDFDNAVQKLSEMNYHGVIFSVLAMEANRRSLNNEGKATIIDDEKDAIKYFRNFELNKKKILFWTNIGFSDHEKYIALSLAKKRNDIDMVFVENTSYARREAPKGIRFVEASDSMKVAYEMETAGYWIFNSDVPEKYIKREGQVYIQTKHWSSVTLKKFFLDIKLYTPESNRHKRLVEHGKLIDYIIAGSDFDIETCKTGFGFDGEFWKIGSPRSDALWNRPAIKKIIHKRYGIPDNMKILIYAPTYRADSLTDSYGRSYRNDRLDYDKLLSILEKRFGEEWIVFLRLHPAVAEAMEFAILPDNVVNVSKEQDSEELVAASDAMLTDYSSIMFEPAYIGLPVFLFAEDLEEYKKQVDFWIPYEELPFPIATEKKQLEKNILDFDEEKYRYDLEKFFNRYGVHEDGQASERAAELIVEMMEK